MEFWGHEVKPGVAVTCEAGDGFVIHLSQAALGETKKGSENVVVFVKVGDKKLAIGTLSADKHPQILCDLFLDDVFELSHNSKTSSVFFCGYKAQMPDMFESDSGEDEDEELETDEIPVKSNETEKSAAKVPAKDDKKDKQGDDNESDDSETSSETDDTSEDNSSDEDEETPVRPEAGKQRAVATASKTSAKDGKKDKQDDDSENDDSETSSETDDSVSEDDSSDDDDISSGTDDSIGDDSEDEEAPVKPEVGKKRPVAIALKTPASDKKVKISTPKKETGDKKIVHVATPYPAKQTSRTPAVGKQQKAPKTPADSKAKEKSPKSGSNSSKSHQKAKKHKA